MVSPICFRIFINHNFGDFEVKISKCNSTLEQPGRYIKLLKINSIPATFIISIDYFGTFCIPDDLLIMTNAWNNMCIVNTATNKTFIVSQLCN